MISPEHTNIEEGKQKEISIKDKKIIDDDINKSNINNNINNNIEENKVIGGGNINKLTYIKYLDIYLCDNHNFFNRLSAMKLNSSK